MIGPETAAMDAAPAGRPLTGRHVLMMLLAFFGVVIGVNVLMMKLAIDTLPGTEVDSAYKASLAFNSEITAARTQDARGWKVAGRVERAPDGGAVVRVEARDGQGAPLTGLAFSVVLARPTDKRSDHVVGLAEAEAGIYRGVATGVAAGQWDVVFEAQRGSERVFLSRNRVMLN